MRAKLAWRDPGEEAVALLPHKNGIESRDAQLKGCTQVGMREDGTKEADCPDKGTTWGGGWACTGSGAR